MIRSETYIDSKACRRGHWIRYASTGHCVECKAALNKRLTEANKEKCLQRSRDWYAANKEKHNARNLAWYARNAPRAKANGARWKTKNRIRRLKKAAEYKRAHRADSVESTARRRATRISATPKWLTENQKQEIRSIYELSESLSKSTGIRHHVDHIVPLRGKTVCGLHVPWNLRAIPWDLNLRKHARLHDL